jgi:hypothetical protein
MAEQLLGPFEKFVDLRLCAAVMLLCLPLHNSGTISPVHELSKRPLYITANACQSTDSALQKK